LENVHLEKTGDINKIHNLKKLNIKIDNIISETKTKNTDQYDSSSPK